MRYRYRFPPLQGVRGTGNGNTTGDQSLIDCRHCGGISNTHPPAGQ